MFVNWDFLYRILAEAYGKLNFDDESDSDLLVLDGIVPKDTESIDKLYEFLGLIVCFWEQSTTHKIILQYLPEDHKVGIYIERVERVKQKPEVLSWCKDQDLSSFIEEHFEYPTKEQQEDLTSRCCWVCREWVSCGNFKEDGLFYCEDHYEEDKQ